MRRRTVAVLGLLLTATATAGCGGDRGDVVLDPPAAESPPVAPVRNQLVTCGGDSGFEIGAMTGPTVTEADRPDIAAGFADVLERAPMDAPTFIKDAQAGRAEWIILAESPTEMTLGGGPWSANGPGAGAQSVRLELESGSWRVRGWGGCHLQPILEPGASWVEVRVKDRPSRFSSTVTVLLNEGECTSARDPGPHLREPRVVETDTSVTVHWTSTAAEGNQSCPGNPTVSRDLELAAPLGDRALLDGSTWPPSPMERRP